MKKTYLILLLSFLLLFVLAASLYFYASMPNSPKSLRALIGKNFGIEQVGNMGDISQPPNSVLTYPQKERWNRPITIFATSEEQRKDGHILSRGFDVDGFERVMVRGQFGTWQENALGQLTGRRWFTMQSAGNTYEINTGKTVKVYCTPRLWYDRFGKPHDLTTVMMEYDVYVDTAPLVKTDTVLDIFGSGDQMAVIARYIDGVFEALLMVGFDCEI